MPDFSQLNIKINSSKPVQQLKKVQSSLDKTASAAQTLTETLKTIGFGIGFGALVKQSLQLNNTLSSLNRKFNTLFDNSVMEDVKELASSLNISNLAAKNAFTTFGQFGKGLGLAKEDIKSMSTELTTAAADYAAFNNLDFQETAKKFAKALTGQTGELKDIGIIIDNNSAAFKRQVEQIQELTGATEAQAKALAISKAIQDQTSDAAGSATAKMFDGWTQLNILLDNFKEVLADVGDKFSTVFGPALKVLNEIMEIPFVKSVTAWSIAIGTVVVGYVALIKTISQIKKLLGDINENTKSSEVRQQALKKIAQQYNKTLKQRLYLLRQISELQNAQKSLTNNKKYTNSGMSKLQDLSNLFNQSSADKLNQKLGNMRGFFDENTQSIEKLKTSLKDLSPSAKQLSNTFGKVIPNDFMELLITMGLLSKVTKSLTAAIIIETIAKKASAAASKINAAAEGLWAGFKNIFGAGAGAAGAAGGFKALGTLLAGLGKALAPLLLALGKLLAVVAGIASAIAIVAMLLEGLFKWDWKEIFHGKIATSLANGIYAIYDIFFQGMEEYQERAKQLTEQLKKMWDSVLKLEELKKDLEKIKLDEAIKKMLPQNALNALALKSQNANKEINELTWMIANMGEARKRGMYQLKDGQDVWSKRVEFQEKLNSLYRQKIQIDNELIRKQDELNKLNKDFSKQLTQLASKYYDTLESFSYGYKNGKFGNYSEDTKKNNLNEDIKEIEKRLKDLLANSVYSPDLQTQAQLLEQLFDKRKELGQLQLNQLNKQREAAINNFKAMQEIVKQAAGFRSSSQSAVEANSMEAMRLQTRQRERLTRQELNPVIEQQKVVQQIEQQMLAQQKTTVTSLSKITDQLIAITGKIGTSKGATNLEVVTPI